MRHHVVSTTFGRSSAHRRALLARLVCCLIEDKRIITTLSRAKAARSLAEKMVTTARSDKPLAARRKAIAMLRHSPAVKALFEQIAPQCRDRSGGYTRIVKLGVRRGDNAPMAILEWVSIAPVDKKKKPAAAKPDEKKPGGSPANA